MAAKKDKSGVDSLRTDIQALSEAFWSFRDAMIADAAVEQAEGQSRNQKPVSGEMPVATDAQLDGAASLLAALGNPVRLRIALALGSGAISVTEIVEKLGLKTTGAAYHHLNVMINSGVVAQPQRGTFILAPDAVGQVHAVMTALFGPISSDEPSGGKKKKK